MNGGQDLGGQMGFGPVQPEPNEPIFHADWEKRVLAINVAAGAMGGWTIDGIRAARESLPPAQYLSSSYYEIWLAGLHKILVEKGFVTPEEAPARFAVGDAVRTRVMHPKHHTRLPRYARGKQGVIERITGCHVFPDTGAQGLPETAQWLYTVVFTGPELWGRDADPTSSVSIEAWESYLEPA
jgi:nitrile hydratase